MVVTHDMAPDKNLYYLGAKILDILLKMDAEAFDIFKLYQAIKPSINISFIFFTYALDWLFMLNLIEINNNGDVKKCF